MNKVLEDIINDIKAKGSLGTKVAERFVFSLISQKDQLSKVQDDLKILEQKFGKCPICNYYTFENKCEVCSDTSRNQKMIFVVTTINDAKSFLDKNKFNGLIHIIEGEINLNKNITPDKLKIEQLFDRIESDVELILALNSTFEGEVTSNYIAQIAKNNNIKVSRLAKGIPTGGVIDYIDDKTLNDAIENRKNV